MNGRALRLLPWAVAGVSIVALLLSGLVGFTTNNPGKVGHLGAADVGWYVSYFVFCFAGALVSSRRPEQILGWLMLGAGAFNAASQAITEYAVWGVVRHPASLPAAATAARITTLLWAPSIAVVVAVAAYFPSGRLASRRWRWLPVALMLTTLTIVVATAIAVWPRQDVAVLLSSSGDPLAHSVADKVIGLVWPVVTVSAVAALVSLVMRYRRASGIERQQLKWIMVAAMVSAPFIPLTEVVSPRSAWYDAAQVLNSPMFFALAAALAILRYRLYDIDRIVSRTVSYAVVTGVIVGIYIAAVAVADHIVGSSSSVAVAASTLAAAAAFQPLRRRVQAGVDRRFNRASYDARRTVEAFSQRLRDQVDVEAVRSDLLDTVDRAVAPSQATLWLVHI